MPATSGIAMPDSTSASGRFGVMTVASGSSRALQRLDRIRLPAADARPWRPSPGRRPAACPAPSAAISSQTASMVGAVVQHAGLDRIGAEVLAAPRAICWRMKSGGTPHHAMHARRVLRGQRGDRGHGEAAQRGHRLDVGLDAGAAAGIRAGEIRTRPFMRSGRRPALRADRRRPVRDDASRRPGALLLGLRHHADHAARCRWRGSARARARRAAASAAAIAASTAGVAERRGAGEADVHQRLRQRREAAAAPRSPGASPRPARPAPAAPRPARRRWWRSRDMIMWPGLLAAQVAAGLAHALADVAVADLGAQQRRGPRAARKPLEPQVGHHRRDHAAAAQPPVARARSRAISARIWSPSTTLALLVDQHQRGRRRRRARCRDRRGAPAPAPPACRGAVAPQPRLMLKPSGATPIVHHLGAQFPQHGRRDLVGGAVARNRRRCAAPPASGRAGRSPSPPRCSGPARPRAGWRGRAREGATSARGRGRRPSAPRSRPPAASDSLRPSGPNSLMPLSS